MPRSHCVRCRPSRRTRPPQPTHERKYPIAAIKPAFKPKQAVTVAGTKRFPGRRKGKFVAEHPSTKGVFLEILLDGAPNSSKFRPSQVTAA